MATFLLPAGNETTMKLWLKMAGIALAIVSGGYFLVHAHRALSGQDLSALLNPNVLVATAALTLLYALAIPITGLAWSWMLRMLGQQTSFGHLVPILAVTQFGKYLPGNVAQHIGRVSLVHSPSVGLSAIVLSIVYETLLSIVACTHISALTFIWALPPKLADWTIVQYRQPLLVLITLAAIVALFAVPRIAARIASQRARKAGGTGDGVSSFRLRWRTILRCYSLYIVNFILTGAGLWLVAHALTGTIYGGPTLLFMTGAFASTWIFGFLAPGAPAGLGVREGVLSAWLSAVMLPSQAIVLILMLRIATTAGDLISLLWGSILMARRRRPKNNVLV